MGRAGEAARLAAQLDAAALVLAGTSAVAAGVLWGVNTAGFTGLGPPQGCGAAACVAAALTALVLSSPFAGGAAVHVGRFVASGALVAVAASLQAYEPALAAGALAPPAGASQPAGLWNATAAVLLGLALALAYVAGGAAAARVALRPARGGRGALLAVVPCVVQGWLCLWLVSAHGSPACYHLVAGGAGASEFSLVYPSGCSAAGSIGGDAMVHGYLACANGMPGSPGALSALLSVREVFVASSGSVRAMGQFVFWGSFPLALLALSALAGRPGFAAMCSVAPGGAREAGDATVALRCAALLVLVGARSAVCARVGEAAAAAYTDWASLLPQAECAALVGELQRQLRLVGGVAACEAAVWALAVHAL
jgi:hypothetical protein